MFQLVVRPPQKQFQEVRDMNGIRRLYQGAPPMFDAHQPLGLQEFDRLPNHGSADPHIQAKLAFRRKQGILGDIR